MPGKNIPQINQDFDVKLLLHTLSKNLIWIVFLFVLSITTAFLLIRYTKPLYSAKSVIQLTESESGNNYNILDQSLNPYNVASIAKEIELIRSPVFLQRVVKRLPVDVSYYSKGAILDFETYKSTPFLVEHAGVEKELFGQQFMVEAIDESNYKLSNTNQNISNKFYKYGDWLTIGNTKFRLLDKKAEKLRKGERFFFVFNDPERFVKDISSNLRVDVLSEAAKTIEISFNGYNPVKVADVANEIAKEFEYFNIEKKQESANKMLEYIDNTLGLISSNIGENEKELSTYVPSDNIDPYLLQMQQDRSFNRLSSIEEQINVVEYDLSILERIKKMPIKSRNDVINVSAIIANTGIESSLRTSLDRFNELYTSYEEYVYSSPDNSPTLNKVRYQLEQQKNAYATSITSVENILSDKLNSIRERKQEINFKSSVVDTNNLNASIIKRTKEINEKFFNQLIDKKAQLTIAKEGFTPEYQILEFASVPDKPFAPNKQMIILSALGAWLLLSLLLVGVRYLLNDEILLIGDIAKYSDAPVLGMIHKYKEDIPVSQLVVDKKPKGLIAEAFRTVRANLQFIHNEPGPKVISLTSTISGEGKTFVSINLAGILAFSGHKVIVIDCDMRKPKIHVGFEVDNEFGMSTILIGKTGLAECIRQSSMENLSFITAGPIPPNPAELLLTKKMDEIIETLKQQYDFIVIDNPPSGLVSDSIVNLQRADYPIYVFRSDYSRKFFINNLIRLKEENQITKISCILNSVDLQKNKSYGYGYGYGSYNYGYGYGYGFGYYEEEVGTNKGRKTSAAMYGILKGKKNYKA